MLLKLANIAKNRVEKQGAQYFAFAIFGIINYPFACIYEYYINDFSRGFFIRFIATILCLLLLLKNKWPKILIKYLPLYWYFTLILSLPILATYMLVRDNFSLSWIVNFNIGVMILVLLVDWISFVVLEILGVIIGVLFSYLSDPLKISFPTHDNQILFLYMFSCIVVICSVFSRNKEKFNSLINEEKDYLNSILEKKVADRTSALEQALKAKTEFLNNMSHEIRSPLQGFTNISEGLVEHWKDFADEKKLKLAQQVASSANRLSSLVSNLLDLSKFSAGKMLLDPTGIDFGLMVKLIIEECNALYMNGKNIEIKFSIPAEARVTADKERIFQVLRNLLVNAIKFSPEESVININIIRSEMSYENGKKVEVMKFSIADEGVGIPEDELESIFYPFTQSSRTKTKAGGTGLGLSIVKEIIEAHNGRVWAKNNEGVGACIEFILPVEFSADKTDEENDLSNNKIMKVESMKKENPIIMIVDDEESCLLSIEMLLHGTNYNLIQFKGGKDAINYLKSHSSAVDVILLDLMMPDMYGLNVLAELKQDRFLSKIPVILQTGTSDLSEIEKAYKMGIISCIRKPYQKHIVIGEIEKIFPR